MKKVIVRAASGAVYVALIVAALLAGQPWLSILLAIFTALAFFEFQHIAFRYDGGLKPAVRVIDTLFGIGLVLAAGSGLFYTLAALGTFVLCYPLVRLTLALYDKEADAFQSTAMSALSILYIALPMGVLNSLYDTVKPGSHLVLIMFILIWLNDTGAYCVGSAFGRRKLFERLSPKKSWEGFAGGMLCCIAAGSAYAIWWPEAPLTIAEGAGLGLIVSIFSTWGDLFESLIKRSAGVKDSGHLIPGHGGILDRIDSLLFVAPATMIYWLTITW
ncbi:MAG: phosphatidate cytidylyltransferase [Muribaculaceae bacterium]|nr:phosphatidate cytidylyltransferase [Muribaculaceae bacterium]MDE6134851.1 phosphatidate cytidylyltransferase [Muribaculaceae bacterium]